MSDFDENDSDDPRLFFMSRKCIECPKALLVFDGDEDDLGEWVKSSAKLESGDHVISNGIEYVFRNGKLRDLGVEDEPVWDGDSFPEEILLSEIVPVKEMSHRVFDLLDKHNRMPLSANL